MRLQVDPRVACLKLRELERISSDHIVDHCFRDIVQEMEARRRNASDALLAHDVLRLVSADHVLVHVHPHPLVGFRIVGEILSLARYLGYPPETQAAARPGNASFVNELVESARYLENAAGSTGIVICALHSFLHVSGENYVLCSRIRTPNEAFNHDLPRFRSLNRGE